MRSRARFNLIALLALVTLGYLAYHHTLPPPPSHPASKRLLTDMRQSMVNQLKQRGIQDQRVLTAMGRVKRHFFVKPLYAFYAYKNQPLPIGHDQTISEPFIVAYMSEQLQLTGDEKVLEIGTGSGYQAAVLSHLARQVYTVEIVKVLAQEANLRLDRLGYSNVQVRHGDGKLGWPSAQPFDAIMVTAFAKVPPEPLLSQLKPGGRLIMPIEMPNGETYLTLYKKTNAGIEKQTLIPVKFVPLL